MKVAFAANYRGQEWSGIVQTERSCALFAGAVTVEGHTCPVALICGGNAAAESVFTAYQQAVVSS